MAQEIKTANEVRIEAQRDTVVGVSDSLVFLLYCQCRKLYRIL
jgi:hypothetical protein